MNTRQTEHAVRIRSTARRALLASAAFVGKAALPNAAFAQALDATVRAAEDEAHPS